MPNYNPENSYRMEYDQVGSIACYIDFADMGSPGMGSGYGVRSRIEAPNDDVLPSSASILDLTLLPSAQAGLFGYCRELFERKEIDE